MFGGHYRGKEPLGDIWFEDPAGEDAELLVKYLFTSERLSIQVHPGDQAARRSGYLRGKDEAWIILRPDLGATIGAGLHQPVSREQLQQAAVDGSIAELLEWLPAAAGDILSAMRLSRTHGSGGFASTPSNRPPFGQRVLRRAA